MLTVFSCTEIIEPEVTPVEQTTPEVKTHKTYSMTITAGKGGATTKALSVSDHVLSATWEENDEVTVYNVTKDEPLTGTLKALAPGSSTTLSGELDGTIENDDILELRFLSPDLSGQDGTLEYIAAHCDYAVAEVTVKSTEGYSIAINESAASFVNQQAIVKFTLNEKNGNAIRLDITKFQVVAGETTVNVTANPSRPDNNVLFVALPAMEGTDLYLKAILDDSGFEEVRAYDRSGVSFEQGKYYEIKVKMSRTAYITNYEELLDYVQRDDDDCFDYLILAYDIDFYGDMEAVIAGDRVLDMNGHTIDGKGKTRLFIVPSGANLTLVGKGTLTGGNTAGSNDSTAGSENGGAFYNAGTLSFNGDITITGNTATGHGGAICNDGTLSVSGTFVASGNTGGNVYLTSGNVITLAEPLNEGSSIGVAVEGGEGTVTSGYSAYYEPTDLDELFSSDEASSRLLLVDGEAALVCYYIVTAEENYTDQQALLDATGLLANLSPLYQTLLPALLDASFQDRDKPATAISYTYWSTDPDGNPVKLSALIYILDAVLDGDKNLTGICLANHGTIASNDQCPTMMAQYEGALAWKNYAMVMPDYYGFGASADRPQGYLDAENTAHNSIDAYIAAVKLLQDLEVEIPDNLYSFGYSQGGFNSMANLKYVSLHPELGIHFNKVICGGSPFDVELTWHEYMNGSFHNSLAFVPMTIVSINETHHLGLSYSDLFEGALLTNWEDWILSKNYTTSEIDSKIKTAYSSDVTISDILDDSIVAETGTASAAIMSVAKSYSLTSGWTPPSGTQIILFHSTEDDTVPYANFGTMTDFLDAVVGSDSYVKKDGAYGGHTAAAVFCVLRTMDEW